MNRSGLVAVAVCAGAAACGGLLAPVGSSSDAGEAGATGDAAPAFDANDESADADGGVPCDYDATDEVLCAPPAADLLYASPPSIVVAAGSYGVATFVASGPWVSDPSFYMWFDGTTVPILNNPQVLTYGSPQSLPFLVPSYVAQGTQGTFSIAGHAGNIERTASVAVTVTDCTPWPKSMVCPGLQCGFEGDGCGGLLSCGECTAPTPFCFAGHCVESMPTPCPSGEGFVPDAGRCLPCALSPACNPCPDPVKMPHTAGQCVSADSLCICYTTPSGQLLVH